MKAYQQSYVATPSIMIVVEEVYAILDHNPQVEIIDADYVALIPDEPASLDEEVRVTITRDETAALIKTISNRRLSGN